MTQPEKNLKSVVIYTDGACEPNPGPGGYGVVLLYGKNRKELSGGRRLTTNNRMELLAAIMGLEALKEPCLVRLYSDSQYLVKAMTEGWAQRWKHNGWWRTKSEKAANFDLWERLLNLCEKHQVEFIWVRGHVGNQENERCDALACQAMGTSDLPEDDGYQKGAIPGRETHTMREGDYSNSHSRVKIVVEGQPCRKCQTPVVKRIPNHKKFKPGQTYFFEYYFYCPTCHTMYMVEEAKVPTVMTTML